MRVSITVIQDHINSGYSRTRVVPYLSYAIASILLIIMSAYVYHFYRISVSTRLVHASGQGNLLQMKRLLDSGTDPNASGAGNRKAIGYASYKGQYDAVKLLLDNGANPSDGLLNAIQMGHPKIVRLLLARGANANVNTAHGSLLD